MKNFLLIILGVFVLTSAQAQNPKKLAGEALKTLATYFQDPVANAGLLDEAKSEFEQAMGDQEFAAEAKNWNKRGDFYSEMGDGQVKAVLIKPDFSLGKADAALLAFDSYKKALEMSSKKGDKKAALKGIAASETLLNNFASQQYTAKNYAGAYDNFKATLDAKDLLTSNGEVSRLDDPAVLKDQTFFTAIGAYYSEQYEVAMPLYQQVFDAGTDEPAIYEGLYKMKSKAGDADALAILEEGRTKFPDDTSLLFGEINHYLEAGELNVLIEKLEIALEKEPDNLSVINTIGSVYDNLHVKAGKDGDKVKAEEYFNQAKGYYEQGLAKNPENFDAMYSIGALYYNKAAGMTEDINKLSNDFSPAGTKKYDALKAEMDGIFSTALPYFEKAEGMKGDDLNTLIALKEIFARQNMFEKVNAYKAKIESIQAGN